MDVTSLILILILVSLTSVTSSLAEIQGELKTPPTRSDLERTMMLLMGMDGRYDTDPDTDPDTDSGIETDPEIRTDELRLAQLINPDQPSYELVKRGGLMRYGKRVFRYGKRADSDDSTYPSYKRTVFRYGKRAGFPGRRTAKDRRSNVFRYGKRSEDDSEDNFDEEKRRQFRFGKRYNDFTRSIRQGPHTPFQFGDE